MKVEPVTNLKRQAAKILADLHKAKELVLITEHGQPSAYLVDVQDYEQMRRRVALLESLAKGERALMEGRVLDHEAAKDRMKKWLK